MDSALPDDTAPIADADGDGTPDDADCAPLDPEVHPNAAERCNDLDDDCDGVVDDAEAVDTTEWFVDADADGWGDASFWACDRPDGTADAGGDCDDAAPLVFPGAPETCDGLDQDCDGGVDEACTGAPQGNLTSGDATMTLWGDEDACDGWFDVYSGPGNADAFDDLLHSSWCGENGTIVLEDGPFQPDRMSDRKANALVWNEDRGEIDGGVRGWRQVAGGPTADLLTIQADSLTGQLLVALDVDPVRGSAHQDADLRVDIVTPDWTRVESLWRTNVVMLPGADGPAIVLAADWITGSDETDNEVWVIDGTATGLSTTMDWPFLGPDARDAGYDQNPWASDAGDLDGDGFHELALNGWRGLDLYWGPLVGSGERPYDVRYVFDDDREIVDDPIYGDLDGDGRDDWLITVADANPSGTDLMRVAWQDGGLPTTLTESSLSVPRPNVLDRFADPADLDGDGELDLVVGYPGYSSDDVRYLGAVYVFYGPFAGARGVGEPGDAIITGEATYEGIGRSVATGDFNADGFSDFAAGNYLGDADDHPGSVSLFFGGPR